MIFIWLLGLISFPEISSNCGGPSRLVFETKNLPKFLGNSNNKNFEKCRLDCFCEDLAIIPITSHNYHIKIFNKNRNTCESERTSNFHDTFSSLNSSVLSHLFNSVLLSSHHFFYNITVLSCESVAKCGKPVLLVQYYKGGRQCQRNIEYQIRPSIEQTKINTFSRVKSNRKLKLEVLKSELEASVVEFKFSMNFDAFLDTQTLTLVMYSCFDGEATWPYDPPFHCWPTLYQHFNTSAKENEAKLVFFTPFVSFANKHNPQLRFEVQSAQKIEFSLRVTKSVHTCSYWNDGVKKWSRRGCWTIAVVGGRVRCGCSHMSIFNAITQFTPKFINFTASFEELLNRNTKKYAISGMASFWLLFLCLAVVARYYDHLDEYKSIPIDLADNDPNDLFMYLVVVNTGKYVGAGTTSKVYIQLFGERSMSSPHKLECRRYRVLKRGQRNLFVLRTERLLGPVDHLVVWIEGYKDNWYVKSLEVIDLETKKIFYFITERWMSPSNLSYLKIYPSSKDFLYKFEPLMVNNICRSFEECNTWFSILYRPIGSNFTRLQRLSRAVTLLLGNLSITLMFFDRELVDDIVRVGKIKLTSVALATALYNLVLVVPFTSTTSHLFKYCRHSKPEILVLPDWKAATPKEERFLSKFPPTFSKSIINVTFHNSGPPRRRRIMFEDTESGLISANLFSDLSAPTRSVSLNELLSENLPSSSYNAFPSERRLSVSTFSQYMLPSFKKLSRIFFTKSTSLMSISKRDFTYSGMDYRDEYLHSYYPHWTYILAWFITISMIVFHTILTMLYVVHYSYDVFEKWIIASVISFMFLIFLTNPLTTLLTALFYSTLQAERFEIPVIHLEDIKEEILKNLSNLTLKEEEEIQIRRASRHREPRNNSSDYQHKKNKELVWQRGLKFFNNEAFFCIFLLVTLSFNASLLHDGFQIYLQQLDHIFQSLNTIRNYKITTEEDYWEWLIEIFESTYDSFSPQSQKTANMILRRPCFRMHYKTAPGNVNFEKIGGLLSSSICITNHYSQVKRALLSLKELNLFQEDIQGITCSFFLYNVVIDKMVSVDLAIRKNEGGGVTFYSNHAAVNLFYTRSNTFYLLSFMFLASGSFCILGVFHRMYSFGFGLFFCNIWNVLMLGMVSFFTGMSFLWNFWLTEWIRTRDLIVTFQEFAFNDFDSMQRLAIIPFAFLLFIYTWRNLYFFCPSSEMYSNLNLISKIVKKAILCYLTPMLIIAIAFTNSIDALTYTNEKIYSRIVKALIATSNNRIITSPKYTHDSWVITFFIFKVAVFVSIMIGKMMCFAETRKKYLCMKTKPKERPPNMKYMSYYLSKIFRTKIKQINFQEHVNYSYRKLKILKRIKRTNNKIRDTELKELF